MASVVDVSVAGTGVGPASAPLATVAGMMAVVALLAAIGPARMERIQTVESLRVDG